jgi:hypothetical protein
MLSVASRINGSMTSGGLSLRKYFELKEETVLKLAILAEKYANNITANIDIIIKLIEFAGNYASKDVRYIVT